MTKNPYSKCDDVSSVTGVKTTDKLLIVGGGDSLAFMKKYVGEVVSISRDQLSSEFVKHQVFDKIFVCDYEADDVAFILERNVGMAVFFIEDNKTRVKLEQKLLNWWPSESWDLVSNVGKCLITDARGYPTYVEVETRYE